MQEAPSKVGPGGRVLLAILASLLVPAAHADPAALLPPILEAQDGTDAVLLSWQPPMSWDGSQTFRVYENNVLITETAGTSYDAPVSDVSQVFHVTMLHAGDESAPSNPVVRARDGCQIVGVNLIPPGYGIDERCIPLDPPFPLCDVDGRAPDLCEGP